MPVPFRGTVRISSFNSMVVANLRSRYNERGDFSVHVSATNDIGAIADADVVYVLRMQRERMEQGANYVPSLREYSALWCVTPPGIGSSPARPRRRPVNRLA